MILPIYAYGQKVLKKQAEEISPAYEGLDELIENMWETMYNAHGVGLAAPQIGLSIRLFIVDTEQIRDEDANTTPIKKVFINAQMLDESGKEVSLEEGCLSIPEIRGDVQRNESIQIRYMDAQFNSYTESYTGFTARVIQHEYDHIEGTLFTEKLPPIKRRLIKRKLDNIRKGKIQTDYRMRFIKA